MQIHRNNHHYISRNIRGKKFNQNSIPLNLQSVAAGYTTFFQWIFIAFIIGLVTISGWLAGFLGSLVSVNIALSYAMNLFYISCIPLVTIIWVTESLLHSFTKSLLLVSLIYLIITVVIVLLVAIGWINAFEPIRFIIFNLLGMAMATFSIFLECLSFALSFTLFPNKNKIIRKTLIVLTILISTLSAYLVFSSSWTDNPLVVKLRSNDDLPDYLNYFVVGGGFLFGSGIAVTGLLATNFKDKHQQHLDFLRTGAIAISTWGSTSFYNLDLSNIDLTGSQLANTDLRAQKLYRTSLQDVTGLERARVDNKYLDLTNSQVQQLLTRGCSEDKNLSRINLQGAYLHNAHMKDYQLIETNLNGADLQNANLSGSILVRAQVTGVDFTGAILTGICIEDWSVNSKTCFARVECEYIYRKLDENGKLNEYDRYPIGRNFEKGEFESLFQEVGNALELVFKDGVNWRALSFTFRKFQLEDDGLGLELKGVEQRGDLWIVKVTHKEGIMYQEVEQRVNEMYTMLKNLVAVKEPQFDQLLRINATQAGALATQAEALKESIKIPFGNNFVIFGSTITNLAGSGQIDYDEAASKIRNIVANSSNPTQQTTLAQSLIEQFQSQSVATSVDKQAELIQQVILTEAKKDPFFKGFIIQQGQQIADSLPNSAIAIAMQAAYSQLN